MRVWEDIWGSVWPLQQRAQRLERPLTAVTPMVPRAGRVFCAAAPVSPRPGPRALDLRPAHFSQAYLGARHAPKAGAFGSLLCVSSLRAFACLFPQLGAPAPGTHFAHPPTTCLLGLNPYLLTLPLPSPRDVVGPPCSAPSPSRSSYLVLLWRPVPVGAELAVAGTILCSVHRCGPSAQTLPGTCGCSTDVC